ncbi:MAG: hypothetical protein D4R64_08555 [Porphyromonadaceae bacterium]|nr:MAG: hypothetical protein D4R64_08555 [Porphyromonadaceae bacterium]
MITDNYLFKTKELVKNRFKIYLMNKNDNNRKFGIFMRNAIVLYFLINTVGLIILSNQRNKNRAMNSELTYKNLSLTSQLSQRDTCMEMEFKNNGCTLSGELLVYDINGDKKSIRELINQTNTIIVRFFEFNCLSCYYNYIVVLQKFSKDFMNHKIIVLTDYKKSTELKYFIRDTKLPYNVYYKSELNLHTPCESLEQPYCFWVDSNLIINNSFILTNKGASLFERYIEILTLKH